jgi:hypothetical protein
VQSLTRTRLPLAIARDDGESTAGEGEAAESELIARAVHDPQAFALLYRRYVEPVYRYRDRCLGGRELAEDATSLIFTKALEALPGCREEVFRRSCGSIPRRDGGPSRVVL